MKNTKISKIARVIILCLMFAGDIFFDFATNVGSNVIEANIDNGFMYILALGFSVGGYKLYKEENEQ